MDNWKHRSEGMKCKTCMFFIEKRPLNGLQDNPRSIGRCRCKSPTLKGWPVVYDTGWCGEHKIDENSI